MVSVWVCMLGACCREIDKAAKEAAKAMQKQEKKREKEENRASKGKQAIHYPVVQPCFWQYCKHTGANVCLQW